MKFSAILGSLAIYGLQVHAIPTDLDPQAIQPVEAISPVSNTLEARDGFCCVVLTPSATSFPEETVYIPGLSWAIRKDAWCSSRGTQMTVLDGHLFKIYVMASLRLSPSGSPLQVPAKETDISDHNRAGIESAITS
ncbi:hypothetical protein E4U16_007940 [Claviceps sp. LM84 group G4]|nr:hypothetical protein E4U33_000213 [Claviceps sp. LM78 group G4]KAG6068516.1 hypothetical protein E4U16_007940 [Claviceps sp. LM84 group G4]